MSGASCWARSAAAAARTVTEVPLGARVWALRGAVSSRLAARDLMHRLASGLQSTPARRTGATAT